MAWIYAQLYVWGEAFGAELIKQEGILNRFLVQAVNNYPLSVYGSGGQTRAFIHISDTVKCIELALKNKFFEKDKVRIFNQVSETKNILQLAKIINRKFKTKINLIKNPRKELEKNDLEVSNKGLKSLGFRPKLLSEKLIEDMRFIAKTKVLEIISNFRNSFFFLWGSRISFYIQT